MIPPPAPAMRLLAGVLACAALLFARSSHAAERVEGQIVQIPAAITTESKKRLENLLVGPLEKFKAGASRQGGRYVVLCDFNPDGKRVACDDFGASLTLAQYLRSLSGDIKGVHVVAYVHGEVTRHSVLPVLACNEIVFSPEAKLGQVTTPERPASKVEQVGYEDLTRNRIAPVLVRKMLDPSVEVLKAGDTYVDGSQNPRPAGEPVGDLGAGQTALYPFELASKLGLCLPRALATLEDVRLEYGLPRGGVSRAIDRTNCTRITVEGALTGQVVEQTRRRIERALLRDATLLIIELRCAGGDLARAYELGLYLTRLNENRPDNPVETIAYVSNQARNLALFPALGCTRIVMQKEEGDDKPDDDDDVLPREARLGGFAHYLDKHPDLEALRRRMGRLAKGNNAQIQALGLKIQTRRAELAAELRKSLDDLASRQNFPAAIIAGMCDRELHLVAVERAKGGVGGQQFLTDEEYRRDQQGPKQFRQVMVVKPWQGQAKFDHRYLTLTADQARQLGLVQNVVKDFSELCTVEGVTPNNVQAPQAEWLDGLADFLRNPWTSVLLVMVGITCLILELKTPGIGLPGVIAAICFVLFFWAHSQLHGQITWLALLLFLLGLALVVVEVFVLPGFGVCGISGIILLLCSLGLVAYGQWPRTGDDWLAFGEKISPFGISMLGSLVCVFLILKYLPHIPVLNRLISKTPDEDEGSSAPLEFPLHAENQALLGAIGVAATPLRPAGKTQFGEQFVDVVADGGFIMPGTQVRVIEVEGNRVVVKEV